MSFIPQTPFPKSRGDTVRSQDWNETVREVQRLDTAKVNKAGDSITGPLVANAGLTVNGALTIPDNSLSGTKLVTNSLPDSKIADNSLSGAKLVAGSVHGGKLQDNSVAASKIPDNTLPGGKLQDNSTPGAKLADNSTPGSKLSNASTHGNKLIDGSVNGIKLIDSTVGVEKLSYGESWGAITVNANSGFNFTVSSFDAVAGVPAPRSRRFLRVTNIAFPAGFTPPAVVSSEIKLTSVFIPATPGNTAKVVEQALWTNPLNVVVTLSFTIHGPS